MRSSNHLYLGNCDTPSCRTPIIMKKYLEATGAVRMIYWPALPNHVLATVLSAAKASTKIEDKEIFILIGFNILEASVDFVRSVSMYALEKRGWELTAVSGVRIQGGCWATNKVCALRRKQNAGNSLNVSDVICVYRVWQHHHLQFWALHFARYHSDFTGKSESLPINKVLSQLNSIWLSGAVPTLPLPIACLNIQNALCYSASRFECFLYAQPFTWKSWGHEAIPEAKWSGRMSCRASLRIVHFTFLS